MASKEARKLLDEIAYLYAEEPDRLAIMQTRLSLDCYPDEFLTTLPVEVIVRISGTNGEATVTPLAIVVDGTIRRRLVAPGGTE